MNPFVFAWVSCFVGHGMVGERGYHDEAAGE